MFTEKFVEIIQKQNIKPYHIAKATGISPGLMSEYKNGKKIPTHENLVKIAKYLGVTVSYLIGEENEESTADFLPSKRIRSIPLYESVAAGFGAYADSRVIGYEPMYIASDWEAQNTIAVKVKGDSMYPKIEDGDIVFVCKDMEYTDGSIVVARIDDDVAVVKRIRCFPAKLVLESINPEYQDRIFERDDMNRVHIEGVVRRIVKPV